MGIKIGSKPLAFLRSSIPAIPPKTTPIGAATSHNPLLHKIIFAAILANLSKGEFLIYNSSLFNNILNSMIRNKN